MSEEDDWEWPESMDAVVAAPESHRVLFENDDVRVLEVTIDAWHREPEHTHRAPSVMIIDGPARIHYYEGGTLTFSSPADTVAAGTRASWMEPEGPHSVENVDDHMFHAMRVELKRIAARRCRDDLPASELVRDEPDPVSAVEPADEQNALGQACARQ